MLANQLLSDITHYMKYAKYNYDTNTRENFKETIDRNKEMHQSKFPKLTDEIEKIYNDFVYTKMILPSMRSLQFGGDAIRANNSRIYNCSFQLVDHYKAFSETMYLLLSGVGKGYSIQFQHVEKLPKIVTPACEQEFMIPDSIEGWSDSVLELVKAYFGISPKPIFNFSKIRNKGMRIITSGGKAPGAEPLKLCLTLIEKVFIDAIRNNKNKLEPIDCHIIQCHIADAVLSGGIRRAAMIALFSFDDLKMRRCKQGEWYIKNPELARANNSVVAHYDEITKEMFFEFWEDVKNSGSGEPGIIWTNNKDWGYNPCFASETLLLSDKGYIEIGKNVGDLKLINKDNKIVNGKIWSNGIKPIIKLTLDNNKTIRLTPNHILMTNDGLEIKAKDCLNKGLKSFLNEKSPIVISIVNDGEEEVFDFNLSDNTHWGVVEGIIAHNCGEASLQSKSFCNLVEINAEKIVNQKQFNDICKDASFINTLQASYTDFNYLRNDWKETTERDALIGTGLTGIASGSLNNIDLKQGALNVIKENKRLANIIGINQASRTTLVKPAGTSSLILNTSSGCHDYYDQYFIKRLWVNKNEPIYGYLKNNFPELLEDDLSNSKNSAVMLFPQQAPIGANIVENTTALSMLERVQKLNNDWIRQGHVTGDNFHNVSATIYVKDHEWDIVGNWMWDNRYTYHGLSVYPVDNSTYKQMPLTKSNKNEFDELYKYFKKINLKEIIENEDNTDHSENLACAGNQCSI